ncbi:MAG: serine protease [Anaerolineae bacterium]|nr:serine protease [Anaerolineae bacterium]
MMNHYRTRPGRAWRARWPRRATLLGMVGLLALLPALGVAQEGAPAGEQPPLGQARATVFLMQVYESRGRQFISCVGSGTLVSPDGLILTNAHNAQESRRCRADAIVVALTVNADEPPVPTYYAEVVVADAGLDLAVLRIARHLDGRLVLQNEIILPFVELGDPDALAVGDRVTIVGYPGIGQDPVEAYTGAVSAFMAEARAGDRAWIKTTASAPGVMSGGGAYDRAGRLVGIPTIAPAGAGTQTIDCRAVQDTNTDGLIDSNDRCIPLGGFINVLRPVRLARPLVRAAQLGVRPGALRDAPPPASGQPAFNRLFFAPSVDQGGQPSTVLAQAPSGTSSLYLFWDYHNMAEGLSYELRTTVNGVPDPRFSLAPVLWSGGESGLWYLGSTAPVLPDGAYEFLLFIEGQPAGSARINVGGEAPALSTFTDLVFGVEAPDGALLGSGHVLPSGINVINARFVYQNMVPDTPWTEVWYYEGAQLYRNDAAWTDGANGVKTLRVSSDQGLPPWAVPAGTAHRGRLADTGDFAVAGGAVGPNTTIFGPITFADEIASNGAPAGIIAGAETPASPPAWSSFSPSSITRISPPASRGRGAGASTTRCCSRSPSRGAARAAGRTGRSAWRGWIACRMGCTSWSCWWVPKCSSRRAPWSVRG